MIGIYKITSPSNKVYVGQSLNIEKRFITYRKKACKMQIKLYRSLIKYGVNEHKFDVIQQCQEKDLNELERYWQDFYNVLEEGLNCKLTNTDSKTGRLSLQTKQKIREKATGRKATNQTKLKMSIARTGRVGYSKGKTLTDEHKLKISIAGKGRKHSDETKLKMSISGKGRKPTMLGKKHTKESRAKMSSILIGNKRGANKVMSESEKENLKNLFSKIVLNTETGIFYTGTKEAAFYNNINASTLKNRLNGNLKNNTNLIYC
jgi:group I intron endonuclease